MHVTRDVQHREATDRANGVVVQQHHTGTRDKLTECVATASRRKLQPVVEDVSLIPLSFKR